jgi:hypothetical protein
MWMFMGVYWTSERCETAGVTFNAELTRARSARLHSQVFLSGTRIRNFTSCQKDPAFLAFFYNRLRRRPRSERSLVKDEQGAIQGAYAAYPFVSHCGREVNYVRAVDTPLVFTSLTHQGEKSCFCFASVSVRDATSHRHSLAVLLETED